MSRCSTNTTTAAVAPPRLVAPLAFTRVTSQIPTLHYESAAGADGAHLQLCADRGCAKVLATIDGDATHATVSSALPAGVVFWRAFGKIGDAIGSQASPVWAIEVGHASADIDTSWGVVPDLNGDGRPDVLIASQGSPEDESPPKAHVYLSTASGVPTTESMSITLGEHGVEPSEDTDVAIAGDMDGDGFLDVIASSRCIDPTNVSMPCTDPGSTTAFPGAVYVFPGSANGPATTPSITLTPPSDESFSGAILGAGDVNGDGYADFLVAATCAPSTETGTCASNPVHIFLGSANGPNATPDATLVIPDANGPYVLALAAGDFDGDGFGDVVIGAGCAPTSVVANTVTCGTGRVYVYLGSASGISTSPAVTWSGSHAAMFPNAGFGANLSGAGDFNGDGYADIAMNDDDPTLVTFTTRVYLGAATLPTTPSTSFTGWRVPLAAVDDIDGDGYDDLIASGAPSSGATITETAALFLGGANGITSTPKSQVSWNTGDQPVPSAWGAAGDLNGDGFGDVVQGIPCVHGAGVYSCSSGSAAVFLGSATGIPAAPSVVLDDPSQEGDDDFGSTLW